MSVESMSRHIVQHFAGFEKVIEEMVAKELTSENLYTHIKDEIGRTLRMKIGFAMDKMVERAVLGNKQLQAKIEARVNEVVRKSFK